jgi:ABC-type multidrug transport system ATPase subunit
MDEAGRCHRVALLQEGRLLRTDDPGSIGSDYGRPLLAVRGPRRHRLLGALREHPHAASVYPFGEELHFTDDREGGDPAELARELEGWLVERDLAVDRLEPVEAGIEDVFMALMGEPPGAGEQEAA